MVAPARTALETTPQGQAADVQIVKWLLENQKATGVIATASHLVDRRVENPSTRTAGQEIVARAHVAAPRPSPTLPDLQGA